MRTLRKAEDRVVLAAMAIYPDGTRELLHYEIAQSESQAAWEGFFKGLQERGLKLDGVELVASDGTNGLPAVLKTWVPNAQHQLCITHKVRAMLRHLGYENLSTQDAQGQTLSIPCFSWLFSVTMPSMTVSKVWRKLRDTNANSLNIISKVP